MSRSKGSLATEFVIITLGVALALAADSAVDRYRDRVSAENALSAVQRDVTADLESLVENRLPRLDSQFVARERLGTMLADGGQVLDTLVFIRDIQAVAEYLTFDANTATVEALKGTGKLDLIRNSDLRAALLRYLNQVENIAEGDVERRRAILNHLPHLIPRLIEGASWRPRRSLSEVEQRNVAAGMLGGSPGVDLDALRELLLLSEEHHLFQRGLYRSARDQAQQLTNLLDDELGAS